MRELVFTLEYAPGTSAVADVLAANPDTTIRSLSCHVTPEHLWRVDHATGDPSALDGLAATVADADYYTDCLARRDCEADWETRILDRTDDTLVLYSYWTRTPACVSIPHLALDHFGDGLVFETTWSARHYEWRVIASGDATYRDFHDAIAREIDETTGVDFVRVGDAHVRPDTPAESDLLSPAQDEAIAAALERGYYETPREIETYELADELGIPGSTLSYRLRRAEAKLAAAYAADDPVFARTVAPDA